MANRYFRIVYLPDGSSQKREIRFTKFTFLFLCSVIMFFLVGVGYFSVDYFSQKLYNYRLQRLEIEKADLWVQISQMGKNIEETKAQIQSLFQKDDYLRNFANIPPYEDDIREVGIGGSMVNRLETSNFFQGEGQTMNNLTEDMDKFARQIELEKESYSELDQAFIRNKELLQHYPSIRPVIGGKTTDRFGWRRDPFDPSIRDNHLGIDLAVPKGSPVFATADGKVSFAGKNGFYGNFILIDHGIEWGYVTGYGHLSKIHVKKGMEVKRGQVIGEVGKTGRATAPHLHYEVRVNGTHWDPSFFYYDPAILK